MKITITIKELFDKNLWTDTCRLIGMNEWAVNEGLVSKDEYIELTIEQAIELGLVQIPSKDMP